MDTSSPPTPDLRYRATRRAPTVPPAEVAPSVPRCRRCSYPLVPQAHRAPVGWRACRARRLCTSCWRAARAAGELIDFERTQHTRDEVLEEWAALRTEGYTRPQAAERLGMSREAFERAYFRARRDGDSRALPALADPVGLARKKAS